LLPRYEHHVLLLLLQLPLLLLVLNAHFVEAWHGDAPSALPAKRI
jgi:hypothetical protein